MATDVRTGNEPSIGSLVGGIVQDVQELTKQQFQMLQAEMKQDFARSREATLALASGLVVAFVGGLILAFGLAHLLHWAVEGLPLWGAFLIVGGLVVAAGGVAAYYGYAKFKSFNPLPDQSLDALKENLTWTNQK